MHRRTFERKNIVCEEEYNQGRDGWCWRESKSYLGEVQKGFWERQETQSIEEDSLSQTSKIMTRLRHTVSINAPKSKGLPNNIWNQRSLESLFELCNTYVHA